MAGTSLEDGAVSETLTPPAEVVTAQAMAERQVLGAILAEPARWTDGQAVLKTEDFVNTELRRLAENVWTHQREEGELVFNEFLAGLPDSALRTLAIELVQEVEQLGHIEQVWKDAVATVVRMRQERQVQQTVAGDEHLSDESLRQIQEIARRSNLRRVGS